MSLFILPISRGARIARVVAVLALDAVLIAAGVAMIMSYTSAREAAERPAAAPPAAEQAPGSSNDRSPGPSSSGSGNPAAGTPVEIEVLEPVPAQEVGIASRARPASADGAHERSGPTGKEPSGAKRPERGQRSTTAAPSESGSGRVAETAAGPDSTTGPADDTDPPPATDPGSDSTTGSAAGSRPDPATARAGPDDADIQRLTRQVALVVNNHQTQLLRCYNRAAKSTTPDEPLQGRVDVQITIAPGGRIGAARVVSNSTGSESLARCVESSFTSWTFPEPPGGEPLDLVWPLRFRAPK